MTSFHAPVFAMLVLCASAAGTTACAAPAVQAQESPAATASSAGQGAQEELVEADVLWLGAVADIDLDDRRVTIRGDSGEERVVEVEDDVERLDRLRVGDQVEVYYHRSIVFDMQPAGSGEPGAYIQERKDHAPDPARPGVIEQEVVTVLSPLVAVDVEGSTISVRSPDGQVDVLDVVVPEHRAALPRLNVGDLLRIEFRRLLTVRVSGED